MMENNIEKKYEELHKEMDQYLDFIGYIIENSNELNIVEHAKMLLKTYNRK